MLTLVAGSLPKLSTSISSSAARIFSPRAALSRSTIFERRQMIRDHAGGDVELRDRVGADPLRTRSASNALPRDDAKSSPSTCSRCRLVLPDTMIAIVRILIVARERRAEDVLRIERKIDRHRGGEQPEGAGDQCECECARMRHQN